MSEEKQEEPSKETEYINLIVIGKSGSVVHFRIKKNTPLLKLMAAYCYRQSVKMGSVRFVFDGANISETDTPVGLRMEEDDTIDVFQTQTGEGVV